jgi:probable phosphoglycerate mutase
MPVYPELLILRHGETEWNREGRMQGSLDSGLTQLGREQARAQNQILRRFGVTGWAWACSPQGRARATADIAAEGMDVTIMTDPRLAEIRLGAWEGLRRHEIIATAPHLFDDPNAMIWYDHAPGGEGLAGLEARAKAFLNTLSGPTVVVTHGITSRMMRCIVLGRDRMDFDKMPGGQGVVHHVSDGTQTELTLGA